MFLVVKAEGQTEDKILKYTLIFCVLMNLKNTLTQCILFSKR